MKQRVNILTIIFISFLLCLFMAGSAMAENTMCNNGGNGGGSSATGSHNYDPSWSLEYAPGNPTELSPGDTAEIIILGGYQNFQWSITGGNLVFVENGGAEIETSKRTLTVRASDDVACETSATIEVTDKNGDTDGGEIIISPSGSLEWDYANSGQTISASGSCTIAVIEEAGGPYTWTVNEGSAYFDAAHTQSTIETTSNTTTLYADNACGTIEVTVFDACDKVAVGQVRAPGQWVYAGEGCMVPSPLPNPSGKYKQIQVTCQKTDQQLCESCEDVSFPGNWGGTNCSYTDLRTCHSNDEYAVETCRSTLCSDGYTPYCNHIRRFLYCNVSLYYEIWTCP